MNVTFDHSEDTAANIKTFWFKPMEPVKFIAGQYTQIRIQHDNPDDRGDTRWFSLSSSPTEPMLSITTKFAEKSSTFKQALRAMQPGTPLNLAQPVGGFVLPQDPTIPLVFVAGGIGVTPMRSMVKWLTDTHEKRTIQLIYAVNRAEELAFTQLFIDYGVEFIPVVNQPGADWQGERGMLDAKRIIDLADAKNGKRIYLSGPEPMIEALANGLKEQGIDRRHIITDFFPGYTRF